MESTEACSMLVSSILDHLGYGLPTVQCRQNSYDKWNIEFDEGYFLVAGSKAEGISKPQESDVDFLCVRKDIVSTTKCQHTNHWENIYVFTLDMTGTPPGYTRLECKQLPCCRVRIVNDSLTEPILGKVYLSSDSWREECRKVLRLSPPDGVDAICLRYSQGPSNPIRSSSHFECDLVCGIICDCPEILQSWIDRPRKYEWPPADVIREISKMVALVVPIGYKGSTLQFLEWRISFTKAEIRLIKSLNDSQVKLLVLLKWVAKHCLKPLCKEMSTYVMKNLVLWLVEKLPASYFTEQSLLNTLMTSLKCLKTCLFKGLMPSYMIPERNLFADRLTWRERSRLCMKIDILVHEGPQLVLRCDKIRSAFSMITTYGSETFLSYCQTGRAYEFLINLGYQAEMKGQHEIRPFAIIMSLFIIGNTPKVLILDKSSYRKISNLYLS